MSDPLVTLWWCLPLLHARARAVRFDDRGEGVISAAIAVLVMAFLGALMWVGFKAIFAKAQAKTDNQVEQIGN